MGSVGDSYDNALMENFLSAMKIELVYRWCWRTRDEAENELFRYIGITNPVQATTASGHRGTSLD